MIQTQRAWLVAAVVLASPGVADAQNLPWHQGVSESDKQQARALFSEAGEFKEQLLFTEALSRYEAALARWENPEIRFEMATILIKLGRPLEAWKHLQKISTWGPDALVGSSRTHARELEQTLLREHLAVIEVRCDEPGAAIALDGKSWFSGPGVKRQVVRPDVHVVTARKAGFFHVVKPVTLLAGKRGQVMVTLSEDRVYDTRRWARWKPWAVVGAGAALGLVGAGLRWQAARDLDRGYDAIEQACVEQDCPPTDSGQYRRGQWESRLSVGAWAAGARPWRPGCGLSDRPRDRMRGWILPAGISMRVERGWADLPVQ